MENEEIEIKLDLQNLTNYKNLLQYFDNRGETSRLQNYFFDDKSFSLGSKGLVLRIRIKGDKAVMTLKGRKKKSPVELAIRREIEEEIPIESAILAIKEGFSRDKIPARIRDEIEKGINLKVAEKFLFFETSRTEIPWSSGELNLILEIDRTYYPDGTEDYELEIELADKKEVTRIMGQIKGLLSKIHIPLVFQHESKFARAVNKTRFEKNTRYVEMKDSNSNSN